MTISEVQFHQLTVLKTQQELYALLNEYKEELLNLYQLESKGNITDKKIHESKKKDAQMNFQMLVQVIEMSYERNRKVA